MYLAETRDYYGQRYTVYETMYYLTGDTWNTAGEDIKDDFGGYMEIHLLGVTRVVPTWASKLLDKQSLELL